MHFPDFPICACELHPTESENSKIPPDALNTPLKYLPPPVTFTAEMAVLADRYLGRDIDWRYYPAFQAAAFLRPKSAQKHADRRQHFQALKQSAESEGFHIPASITELFLTDAYIDQVRHNCVWPTLPKQIIRHPADPAFGVLLFLSDGQGGTYWHLLLAPDGTHTVATSDTAFGRTLNHLPTPDPDYAKCPVSQCIDSANRLLYHYFTESARHDAEYVERLAQYFSEVSEAG